MNKKNLIYIVALSLLFGLSSLGVYYYLNSRNLVAVLTGTSPEAEDIKEATAAKEQANLDLADVGLVGNAVVQNISVVLSGTVEEVRGNEVVIKQGEDTFTVTIVEETGLTLFPKGPSGGLGEPQPSAIGVVDIGVGDAAHAYLEVGADGSLTCRSITITR